MTLVGDDFGERHPRAAGIERMHDGTRFRRREQPVGGERDHAEARRALLPRIGEHAVVVGGEIEIVHRAREIEIGIGVEALDERDALVAQIAFHLKIGIERERRVVAILEAAPELPVQRRVREVGDVRAHARDRKPFARIPAFGEIAPLAPFRIGHDRLTADLVERDVLRRVARRRRDRQRGEHALGIARGPLQHLHAAHRAAGDGEQRSDAEMIEQHRLRAHHVADGDDRKIQAPRRVGLRIGRRRTGRAHAGADDVRADHEIALGVDRAAGPDHRLPPTGFAGDRMNIGDVLVAGERVADQHRVGAVGIQCAVGLVGDLKRREVDAGVEPQRLVRTKTNDVGMRLVGLTHTIHGSKHGLDHSPTPCQPPPCKAGRLTIGY